MKKKYTFINCFHLICFIYFIQSHIVQAIDITPQIKLKNKNNEILNILGKEIFYLHSFNSLNDSVFDFSQPNMNQLEKIFKNLKPNFITEGISIIPIKNGIELYVLKLIINKLKDITFLDTIPYYSKRHHKYFPLFTDSIIIEKITKEQQTNIIAEQKMLPFEISRFSYTYIETENIFLFTSENITPLIYNGITAASQGAMRTAILIEVQPGFLVCYGLGGTKTFTFFGLFNDRLETAIAGRIEAFYNWFFNQYLNDMLELQ
jgi:hypothetical protein